MTSKHEGNPVRQGGALALAVAALMTVTGVTAIASAAPAAAAGALKVTVTSHFVFQPTTGGTSGDSTFINNGATNGKKNDLLFVMPNLTPGGISPCPCLLSPEPPIGVRYNGSQWGIFNEDGSDIGILFSYNVLVVPNASKSAFAVHATSSNTHGDHVIINSPLTNGHPNALIQITQNFNPAGVPNPHQVGVRYLTGQHRWAIFNEDGAAMPHNASFNVLVGRTSTNGGRTNVLTTTTANRPTAPVTISNPETNGNPNNVVFATQDFNPGGKGGTGNKGFVIASYSGSHELLFNWGSPPIPLKTAFNLLIYSS